MPVYKDKKRNTWYVSKRYKDWKGDSQREVKRGFETKKAASDYEKQFLSKLNGNQNMIFNDFVNLYLEDKEKRLKKSTFLTKRNIIEENIRPYFKNMKMNTITPTDVMKWQNIILETISNKGQKYSNSTLKTIHAQLSAIFNHAVRYYHLDRNPANIVGTMSKPEKKEMLFWTREEYKRFSFVMMDKPISFICFEVLYWCGIRIGELLALTRNDFELDNKKLHINKSLQRIYCEDIVTTPKTVNSNRIIDMPDFLVDELQDYFDGLRGLKPDDRVFPITKSYLHHEMDRGCIESGVKRIRIHDLRHSHVSLLIEKGFSALAIAERVGHESIRVTYKYAHLFPSKGVEIANSLNEDVKGDDNHE